MATACLFIGWDRPEAVHQSQAYQFLMQEGLERIAKWKKDGWCESYDVIALTPHCGAVNGFLLLKGERAKLDELRRTDEFERFSMSLGRMFIGYGVVPGVTEEGIKKVAARVPELLK